MLGLLLLAALSQAPALDVSKIVKEVAEKAGNAKQYSFEGELTLAEQRGSNPGRVLAQARVRLASAPGGKFLLRVEAPGKGEYLLVSDGQKSWAYVPKLKQYTEEEAARRPDDAGEADESEEAGSGSERDLAEVFARQVVPILAGVFSTAESAAQAGEAEVKYEKKKRMWPVLRVISKRDSRNGASMTELTLDPASLQIGRLLWANVTYSNGEKIVVRLTVDFTSFQMDAALPDDTFTFTPPKHAKLVDAVPIPGQTGSFLLNRPAPDFELKTLDGQRVRLGDLRGKPVLLSFWASWCGPCRRELPDLVRLYGEFKDRGLFLAGINDEGKGTARRYAQKAGLTFTILDDSGEKVNRLYRVRSIPSTFLIDRDGKVVRFLSGAHDYASLRSALKAVGL
jgi:peroxiredoxin/outer membrane lipoprotein-sorting protein